MKNVFLLLIFGLFLSSCDKGDTITPEQDLSTSLNLKITKLNSTDNNTYPIQLKDFARKYSNWTDYTKWVANTSENINIEKRIIFLTQLPTGEALEIEVALRKIESEQLLKLDDKATKFDHWQVHKEWDYINYKDKVNNFYNSQVERSLTINGSNVMFGRDGTFDIVNKAEVSINGEPKTRVTIKFKGDLYPFYSNWNSPADATYSVEGEFSGIIE